MKVPGLDGVFYYRQPLGANCVVYAFKRDDGMTDLIDTGIYYIRPVLASVVHLLVIAKFLVDEDLVLDVSVPAVRDFVAHLDDRIALLKST